MSARLPLARLDRRALLLGAGGLLVTGCGGGGGSPDAGPTGSASATLTPTPTPSGPIIHQQDAGNVMTQVDIDALVARLNEAVRSTDVEGLRAIVPTLNRGQWQRRLENIARFPITDLGFTFEDTYDRQTNSSGGRLEIDANVALTHRIEGVDPMPAAQIYRATLAKETPESPIEVLDLRGPNDDTSPAPWDLADWQVFESEHAVVAAQPRDADRVRANLAVIDRSAAFAMTMIPPPAGMTRAYFAIGEAGSGLYGSTSSGQSIQEASGYALRIGFAEAAEAAREGGAGGGKAPYAGGRLMLNPSAFDSTARLEQVATHETLHALSYQWGIGDPWTTEGVAVWGEHGGLAGLRADGAWRSAAVSGFSGFAARMRGIGAVDYGVFHDDATESTNYHCAGAVYGFLESQGGRDAVLRFGRLAFSGPPDTAAEKLGHRDVATLFGQVQQWLATL